MHILNRFALVSLAAFALAVVAACGGDDGDDAFELPPPGEYRFEVTGTMEVEFPAEGVSAVPIALQETETGEVSGSLTSIVVGNTLTIPELGFTVTFGATEITFGPTFPEAMGSIGPDGTTWDINMEAMLPSGEVLTGQAPFELEGDSNPFSDNNPPFGFNPPPGWGPVPFTDGSGNDLLIIHDFSLDLTMVEGPPVDEDEELSEEDLDATIEAEIAAIETEEAECVGCTSFADEEGDDVFCETGEPANNPTVDITGVNFFGPPDDFHVEVFTGASPADAFDNDFSWSVGVSLGGQMAIAEAHNKFPRVGLLEPDGGDFAALVPGSAEHVIIGETSVRFDFPPIEIDPGTPWNVETFSLKVDGEDDVSCDTAEGTLP